MVPALEIYYISKAIIQQSKKIRLIRYCHHLNYSRVIRISDAFHISRYIDISYDVGLYSVHKWWE